MSFPTKPHKDALTISVWSKVTRRAVQDRGAVSGNSGLDRAEKKTYGVMVGSLGTTGGQGN